MNVIKTIMYETEGEHQLLLMAIIGVVTAGGITAVITLISFMSKK